MGAESTLDIERNWKIERTQSHARDYSVSNRYGYKNEPLIDFIEFDCVVIDLLHLLLRISDQLFDRLQEKLIQKDNNDSIELANRPCFQAFELFLRDNCKITKPFIFSIKNTQMSIRMRSLNGSERGKIFTKIFENDQDFDDIFANLDLNFEYENYVWKNFIEIYLRIKVFDSKDDSIRIDEDVASLKNDLKDWLEIYILLSGRDHITPYIHAFVFHIPEFILKYRKINLYNVQGLEKLNDLVTKSYHRSTNKKRTDKMYLFQLIKKQNRLEFYNLQGNYTVLPR